MFVRVKTTPNSPRKSVQIVASERVGTKVKQRIVRHVGIAMNEDELVRLRELAEYIKTNLEEETSPSLFHPDDLAQWAVESRRKAALEKDLELNVNLRALREENRIIVGIHDIYGKLFSELGFAEAVGNPSRRVKAAKVLKHLVMARIANPASKRASVTSLERDFGVQLDITSVYRTLDYLDDERTQFIQDKSWQSAANLFEEKIDVIFYDCTTLYFESVEEDELRDKGYSKDMKFNQSQVLLALMVTKQGIPVGYRLYNGSTFEGDTLKDAVNHIEQQHQIDQIIFVADSAMLSQDNLAVLEQSEKKYIVGARIKGMANTIKEQILDTSNYTDKDGFSYKEIDLTKGRRLLVNYSEKRARKDAFDRQASIDKLLKKLEKSKSPENFISNYGYKKYLKIDKSHQVELNQNKIDQAAQWDGLHGVITNIEDTPASQIFGHYKGLWQVEESFRITKHDLQVRPIYHWTPQRIKAHIAICFMALVCVRHLTYRVALQYEKLSPEVIRTELTHIQLTVLKNQATNHRYGIPSKLTQHARKIYQVMGEKLSDMPFAMN